MTAVTSCTSSSTPMAAVKRFCRIAPSPPPQIGTRWLNREGAGSKTGRSAYGTNIKGRMNDIDLDPGSSIEGVLEVLESVGMGVEIWTSGKRSGSARYRCRLFRLGPRIQRVVWAEASTAWEAVASAVVTAFEEGHIERE